MPHRGRSSGVEHNLAKVGVVGSNPIARSSFLKSPEDVRPGFRNRALCRLKLRVASRGALSWVSAGLDGAVPAR